MRTGRHRRLRGPASARRRHRGDVVCDLLEYGGEDLQPFPLSNRKRLLAKLVGSRSLGSVLSQHTDEDIFRGVCQMGLERYCLETPLLAVPIRPVNGLAED
jgi:ATP-dependent DNA ligase